LGTPGDAHAFDRVPRFIGHEDHQWIGKQLANWAGLIVPIQHFDIGGNWRWIDVFAAAQGSKREKACQGREPELLESGHVYAEKGI
jgi:hypothetical protein